MKKEAFLAHWRALPPDQPLQPRVIPYKHEGSTYAEDGIRITGSREWIDAVLSRLKDLLAFENGCTRLQVAYQESTDRARRSPLGSWNCYLQVHQRGREAQIMHAFIDAVRTRTPAALLET
jgi:hypothetical protein